MTWQEEPGMQLTTVDGQRRPKAAAAAAVGDERRWNCRQRSGLTGLAAPRPGGRSRRSAGSAVGSLPAAACRRRQTLWRRGRRRRHHGGRLERKTTRTEWRCTGGNAASWPRWCWTSRRRVGRSSVAATRVRANSEVSRRICTRTVHSYCWLCIRVSLPVSCLPACLSQLLFNQPIFRLGRV